jgi:hypothetical protein
MLEALNYFKLKKQERKRFETVLELLDRAEEAELKVFAFQVLTHRADELSCIRQFPYQLSDRH